MKRLIILGIALLSFGCEQHATARAPQPEQPAPTKGSSKVSTADHVAPDEIPRDPPSHKLSSANPNVRCALSRGCIEHDACSHDYGIGCVVPDETGDFMKKDYRVNGPCRDACYRAGMCEKTERGCVARSDEDCEESINCFWQGTCKALDGHCVAKIDEDCQKSQGCVYSGYCRASGGICLPLVDSDCRGPAAQPDQRNSPCREEGRCSVLGGECQAVDCVQRCKYDGRCDLEEKRVVNSRHATSYKICTFNPSVECSETTRCRTHGECENGKLRVPSTHGPRYVASCVPNDEGCRLSEVCFAEGKCFSSRHGMCVQENHPDRD